MTRGYVIARTSINDTIPPILNLLVRPLPQDDGTSTLETDNPDAAGHTLPGTTGTNVTLSCQPDGSLECRPTGAAGLYEKCYLDASGNATFFPGQGHLGPSSQWTTVYLFLGSANVPLV